MESFVQDSERPLFKTLEDEIRALIKAGESSSLEFKSSARWDLKLDKHSPDLEEVIVKTTAGFLNSHGGTLLIGVDDSGAILGLAKDYENTKGQTPGRDSFELWLTKHLMSRLGKDTKPYFHLDFASPEDRDVCRIVVYPSPKPVFVEKGGLEVLFVRQGNATNRYDKASDILAYTTQHWADGQPSPSAPPTPASLLPGGNSATKVKPLYSDFREVGDQLKRHPNERYFILKSIIINNLFGVDIMEEATEICKLRLFLKLVAQLESVAQIEPLPDIDFNIRTGNTLVGFVSLDQVRKSQEGTLGFAENQIARIEEDAEMVDRAFKQFRSQQTTHGGTITHKDKQELRSRLTKLDDELDRYLAGEYGINVNKPKAFDTWTASHQPFHWFVEFYGIMSAGGFDVIVGNPPYISASKVRQTYTLRDYSTTTCTDIYANVQERCVRLLTTTGRCGMIVPLSLGFSGDFAELRRLLYEEYQANWFSSFARIPSALFSADVRVRNTIHIGARARKLAATINYTTVLHRWFEACRPNLFAALGYVTFDPRAFRGRIPKINTQALCDAFSSLAQQQNSLDASLAARATKFPLYFKQSAYNWLNFCKKLPPCYGPNGERVAHTKFGEVWFDDSDTRDVGSLFLNGKIVFAYWCIIGDDFDVTRWMFAEFPSRLPVGTPAQRRQLIALSSELDVAMLANISFKLNAGKRVGNYNLAKCRSVTDRSDRIFAVILGLDSVLDDIELMYTQLVKTDFSVDDHGDAE